MKEIPTDQKRQNLKLTFTGIGILLLALSAFAFSFKGGSSAKVDDTNIKTVPSVTIKKIEEVCRSADGVSLSLEEARKIASEGVCGETGALQDTFVCNEFTGTWWLDLDITKEGCSPACVVDVSTGKSEINWRCTGLLQEETTVSPTRDSCSSGCGCGN